MLNRRVQGPSAEESLFSSQNSSRSRSLLVCIVRTSLAVISLCIALRTKFKGGHTHTMFSTEAWKSEVPIWKCDGEEASGVIQRQPAVNCNTMDEDEGGNERFTDYNRPLFMQLGVDKLFCMGSLARRTKACGSSCYTKIAAAYHNSLPKVQGAYDLVPTMAYTLQKQGFIS